MKMPESSPPGRGMGGEGPIGSPGLPPGGPTNAHLVVQGTPQPTSLEERKSPLTASTITMQGSDAVRLSGVSEAINSQIAKYDSSEFDDDKEVSGTDAEGVWAPEIEQSFQEALAIYPPCGRRKIILSDEGKMYGRNELIARYIKLRTGKTRTRKQVSSHIQVLARRKLREIQAKLKVPGAPGGGVGGPGQGVPGAVTQYSSEQSSKEKAIQQMQQMSSAQIVSATAMHKNLGVAVASPLQNQVQANSLPVGSIANTAISVAPVLHQTNTWQPFHTAEDVKPTFPGNFSLAPSPGKAPHLPLVTGHIAQPTPVWLGRSIATRKLRLLEHSAFVEDEREPDSYQRLKHLFVHIGSNVDYSDPHLESVDVRQIQDKFPEKSGGLKDLYEKGPQDAFFLVKFWADLNTNIPDDSSAFYGVTTTYESTQSMTIQCSTKVCSFGKQVVEKVETEWPRHEGGRYVYKIHRSGMCEYMINFIHKLKHLPEKYMMNSVLENFTILQVITDRDSGETLLCIAYVFEVSTSEHGAQHHIYRLVKDNP